MTASLWVDKYRPQKFDDLTFHKEINTILQNLVQQMPTIIDFKASSEDVPHLLISGPRGAGKMTRVRAFLNHLFDSGVYKLKIDEKAFQTPSGRKIELTVFSSNYHVELNPSEVGVHDRVIVQEVIKELAQTQQIDKSRHSFKVVVILEADRLSKDAQHGLRRTMEKFSSNLRVILCCTSSSRIIWPIKSRCFALCVPAPSNSEIKSCIEKVASFECQRITDGLCNSVVSNSDGNVRRALLAIEASVAKNSQTAERPDWEHFIDSVVEQVIREQSPASLLVVRSKLYDLLTHSVPPSLVIKMTLLSILPFLKNPKASRDAVACAAFYVCESVCFLYHLGASDFKRQQTDNTFRGIYCKTNGDHFIPEYSLIFLAKTCFSFLGARSSLKPGHFLELISKLIGIYKIKLLLYHSIR